MIVGRECKISDQEAATVLALCEFYEMEFLRGYVPLDFLRPTSQRELYEKTQHLRMSVGFNDEKWD